MMKDVRVAIYGHVERRNGVGGKIEILKVLINTLYSFILLINSRIIILLLRVKR